jgi:hypothetical protein
LEVIQKRTTKPETFHTESLGGQRRNRQSLEPTVIK